MGRGRGGGLTSAQVKGVYLGWGRGERPTSAQVKGVYLGWPPRCGEAGGESAPTCLG